MRWSWLAAMSDTIEPIEYPTRSASTNASTTPGTTQLNCESATNPWCSTIGRPSGPIRDVDAVV